MQCKRTEEPAALITTVNVDCASKDHEAGHGADICAWMFVVCAMSEIGVPFLGLHTNEDRIE